MVFTQLRTLYIELNSLLLYETNYVTVKILTPCFHKRSWVVYLTGNIRARSIVNTGYATIAGTQPTSTDVQAHNFNNTIVR